MCVWCVPISMYTMCRKIRGHPREHTHTVTQAHMQNETIRRGTIRVAVRDDQKRCSDEWCWSWKLSLEVSASTCRGSFAIGSHLEIGLFKKRLKYCEFFLLISLFLLISSARHGVLKVLKK